MDFFSSFPAQLPPHFSVSGVNSEQWGFFFNQFAHSLSAFKHFSQFVFVCETTEEAERLNAVLTSDGASESILLTGMETSPYRGFLFSEDDLTDRFNKLNTLATGQKNLRLILTLESLLCYVPEKDFFTSNSLTLSEADIMAPHELAQRLVSLGYNSEPLADRQVAFSNRGEIFDIYPLNSDPIRLHFFDEMIEALFPIDLETGKTLHDQPLEKIQLGPSPEILASQDFSESLKSHLVMPPSGHRLKFEKRQDIFYQLSLSQTFENYPAFFPLFFKKKTTIIDYLDSNQTLLMFFNKKSLEENWKAFFADRKTEFLTEYQDSQSPNLAPEPSFYYQNQLPSELMSIDISATPQDDSISLSTQSLPVFFNLPSQGSLKERSAIILKQAKEFQENGGRITLASKDEKALEEVYFLLKSQEISPDHFIRQELSSGFYFQNENTLILSTSDFFGQRKISKPRKQKRQDFFSEQMASLKEGDYIIHKHHGIGCYKGMQSMSLGSEANDFLLIEYKGRDKVYVPVYKMNLIQKHADASQDIKLADLRSQKFSKAKSRAREAVKKLAFDLLKLQAERKTSAAFAFSAPDHLYHEFELAFPFNETEDQLKCIDSILEDMQSPSPMDRLVCGDVGFGKTEVAMRAAFKAIVDQKQVAILVPTTILALQHYNSFKQRFKNFAVNITSLSRLKTAKQSQSILQDLEQGKVDIIIGTHKLLSEKVKFYDLGLVIIDEEQRFGVGHKERLKLLKKSVDFLTLSATPIPRTLQMGLLGLKDLSLIQTPPANRRSIKTYVIREDQKILKEAIQREISRGGQVFYVHNKVQDIEILATRIRQLVPGVKLLIAHGQLPEREIEKKMEDFYSGQYDILLATTIIESGLDVPTANTMIVNNADHFGLSQLHQLRGRIGRSSQRAYAYFVIPQNKVVTPIAQKRLEALQNYSDVGAGFFIASSDLDLRGSGDILGPHQSGHMEAIGMELYMELMEEAVADIQGTKKPISQDVELQGPEPAYIPESYIQDSSQRLRFYKKLSHCSDLDELADLSQQLQDQFGTPPEVLKNLFKLLQVKIILSPLFLKSIKAASKSITLQFIPEAFEDHPDFQKRATDYFLSRPKTYKISPDYAVTARYKEPLDMESFLAFAKMIAAEIVPC